MLFKTQSRKIFPNLKTKIKGLPSLRLSSPKIKGTAPVSGYIVRQNIKGKRKRTSDNVKTKRSIL
jgi:hypothetical protein